jgi:hypothetical protein
MSQPAETIQQRVRFEEVTPANTAAAFLDASIESLVLPLGLPIYDGYDGLDDLQLTFLTLPSGETVTLASYLNPPQPGTSIHVDSAVQNIPQVIFESCQQLRVSREEVLWFNPDLQEEIDRLYAEHSNIEKTQKSSQFEELPLRHYEPIDCLYHAIRIYDRQDFPLYWAMLQHNLGLAYFNRRKGSYHKNLQESIRCFKCSMEIYTEHEFQEKWAINQYDLKKSQQELKSSKKKSLIKNIIARPLPSRQLQRADLIRADLSNAYLLGANLSGAKLGSVDLSGAELSYANLSGAKLGGGNLSGANLHGANLYGAKLGSVDLSGADLRDADLINTDLSGANLNDAILYGANLNGTNLSVANVNKAMFGYNPGISVLTRQDLIARGAIFDDSQGDRYESRNLVSR